MISDARLRLGVVPVGRSAFDLELARRLAEASLDALASIGASIFGSREILETAGSVEEAMGEMPADLAAVVVVQATFTDATAIGAVADAWAGPLGLWGFPEERTGGRLRTNSFCGLNLAGYRLGRLGRRAHFRYASPSEPGLGEWVAGLGVPARPPAAVDVRHPGAASIPAIQRASLRLAGARIGIVGEPPDGFDPCVLSEEDAARFGAEIVKFPVEELLGSARSMGVEAVEPVAARLAEFDAVDRIDPGELDRSARLGAALMGLVRDLDALAVRCWPECFTEFGAAACAPIGLMNDDLVPTTCEADGFGCLTGLVLDAVSDQPSVSVDLVAPDFVDDTAVVWHCGQLPPSMSADGVSATVHSNRGTGVLGEFRLRPGTVTLARISAARGEYSLVVGKARVLDRPRPFSGTSGVIRFERPVRAVVDTVLGLGLDHHLGLVYGDHRAVMAEVADQLRLPLIWL